MMRVLLATLAIACCVLVDAKSYNADRHRRRLDDHHARYDSHLAEHYNHNGTFNNRRELGITQYAKLKMENKNYTGVFCKTSNCIFLMLSVPFFLKSHCMTSLWCLHFTINLYTDDIHFHLADGSIDHSFDGQGTSGEGNIFYGPLGVLYLSLELVTTRLILEL